MEAQVDAYNAAIPAMVDRARSGGCATTFVDMNAALTEAISAVLEARCGDPESAFLAAGAAMLAQQAAFRQWTRPGETRTLRELLPDALHALRTTVDQKSADPPLPA